MVPNFLFYPADSSFLLIIACVIAFIMVVCSGINADWRHVFNNFLATVACGLLGSLVFRKEQLVIGKMIGGNSDVTLAISPHMYEACIVSGVVIFAAAISAFQYGKRFQGVLLMSATCLAVAANFQLYVMTNGQSVWYLMCYIFNAAAGLVLVMGSVYALVKLFTGFRAKLAYYQTELDRLAGKLADLDAENKRLSGSSIQIDRI